MYIHIYFYLFILNLDVRTMVSPMLWQICWWRCNTLLCLRTAFTIAVYHWPWSGLGNFVLSRQTWRNLQYDLRLHCSDFYFEWTVNIGYVSIIDYLEMWNVGQSRIPSLCLQHSLLTSLLCVCLHCTVSSAYTSVHNLATHMCFRLSYNCHLHSL